MIKSIQALMISLIILPACNNPVEKTDIKNNSITFQDIDSKPSADTILKDQNSEKDIPVKEESAKKNTDVNKDELTDVAQADEKSFIVPGYVKNEFTKEGNTIKFKRTVKENEDTRVGGSGGGSEISFTVNNAGESFVFENQSLKNIVFKYHITGEIYEEFGEDPYKGKVSGTLLPGNKWQIEINVWIKMKDLQFNREVERQIQVKDVFRK